LLTLTEISVDYGRDGQPRQVASDGATAAAWTNEVEGSGMHSAPYYRERAACARRLIHGIADSKTIAILREMADEYDAIAAELERGEDEEGRRRQPSDGARPPGQRRRR
jgi:hypothetical protein